MAVLQLYPGHAGARVIERKEHVMTKITPGLEAAIVARIEAGETRQAVAVDLGLSVAHVSRIGIRNGLRSHSHLTPEAEASIVARVKAGETQRRIAADLGVDRATVARVCTAKGVRSVESPFFTVRRWDDLGPDLSWQDAAVCADHQSFTEMVEPMQRAICAGCPVRDACLSWTFRWGPPFNVFQAGLSRSELKVAYRDGRKPPVRVGRAA